jgi:hypothetical protein
MLLFHGSPKIGLKELEIGLGEIAAQGPGVYLSNDKKAANFYAKGYGSIYTVSLTQIRIFHANNLSFLQDFFKSIVHDERVKSEIELFSAGASSFSQVLNLVEGRFSKEVKDELIHRYDDYPVVQVQTLMSKSVQFYLVKDPSLLEIIKEEPCF